MKIKSLLAGAVVISILCIGLIACSNEAIYRNAQQNRELECQKYPDSRYEECMRTIEKNFNEYENELREVDESKGEN